MCAASARPAALRGCRVVAAASTGAPARRWVRRLHGLLLLRPVIGRSWEDAARNAVEVAAKTFRDLRVAEVTKLDMKIDDGKVVAFRARVQLSFKYEG